ncbi:hypothetical protein CROQUDRAFT_650284 [Cronartium quercuum f. sp. fusiforme G11]|uniref:GTP 3',8-cyclase n=1 Tax=Cronartium quercuum f. sp. fusiforme G11 TaxID=708437 RepID=A0A9P6NV70_9BASI|nr:hypothetical protein CROQUDRAFT_650284 [Cronartium quercuum f. sp. fusiforme G11]
MAKEKLRLIDQSHLSSYPNLKPKISSDLIDRHGRHHNYLRISLTERCNLRCQYCMSEDGIPPSQLTQPSNLMTTPELLKITSMLVRHGINKVRFTGGEPSLRSDLPDIIHGIKKMGGVQSIGMTSNGIILKRKLSNLLNAGLTNLNLSLDTLDPLKFELITRRKGHHVVLDCLNQALDCLKVTPYNHDHSPGLDSVKLNVVVIRGLNDMEINDFVRLTDHRAIKVRFIEYMPFEGNAWSNRKLVAYSEMLELIKSQHADIVSIPSESSDTTKYYQIPGFKGQIGFISSMSEHFCGGCNRLRLGADGKLKVCLFGPPNLSILPYLRDQHHVTNENDLMKMIGEALQGKHFKHAGHQQDQDTSTSVPPTLSAMLFHPTRDLNKDENSTWSSDQSQDIIFCWKKKVPSFRFRGNQVSGLNFTKKLFNASKVPGNHWTFRPFSHITSHHKDERKSLTHIDEVTGNPKMVDITEKIETRRTSKAIGFVIVPIRILKLFDQDHEKFKKGNPIIVAQLAGIQAIKRTSELIPLCHNSISINFINLEIDFLKIKLDHLHIRVQALVSCIGKTGVEIESLTGVSIACLTLFDMLKSECGKEMVIEGIRVLEKSGGKNDYSTISNV